LSIPSIGFPPATVYRHFLAVSCNNLGSVLAQQGRRTEAEAAYRKAVGIRKQLAQESPTDSTNAIHLSVTYFYSSR
jgi:Tetratricopeptide repeat